MRKMFLLIFLISSFAYSQLLEENFDYGGTATDLVTASSNVWSNHSGGTGSLDVQYITSGLSYADYVSSGVGGAASLSNSRTGDNNRTFTSQTSGSIFLSALINIVSATSTAAGEYILHYGTGSTSQYCRLYIRNETGNLRFGISKSSEGATFSTNNYSFSTTYLIIMKYTFNNSTQDDRVDLWVISSGVPTSEVEAGSATISNVTAANDDISSISAVSVRQGSVAHSATIDGIRVATSWSQAPLPVELTSFTATENNNTVTLHWITATEVNNYGFEIQRSVQNKEWQKIGFVNGNGNSNSPKEYTYTDQPNGGKEFSYRLKQIDFDGSYEYSGEITVTLEEIKEYKLYQNYPNPFNPETIISYSLPTQSYVRLKVYDMLGREIAILIDKEQEAGNYITTFNTQDYLLSSGVYYIVLQSGNFTETKKCILIK